MAPGLRRGSIPEETASETPAIVRHVYPSSGKSDCTAVRQAQNIPRADGAIWLHSLLRGAVLLASKETRPRSACGKFVRFPATPPARAFLRHAWWIAGRLVPVRDSGRPVA